MKFIFEEDDIKVGMCVICNSYPKESTNYEFAITVMYKIGWLYDKHESENKYCLISISDGWISIFKNKKKLVEHLNNKKGYRVLNVIEMTDILRKDYIKSIR